MFTRLIAKFLGLLTALVCMASVEVGQAAVIVGYSGTTPSVAAPSGGGVTDAGITRGPGVSSGVASGAGYGTRDWTTNNAIDTSDYIQFGWTAAPGFGIHLSTLEIQYKRTGSGPTALNIQISKNGGAFQSIFSDTTVTTQNEFHSINLGAYNQATSAIFRIFAYNANNSSGQLDFTNFAASSNTLAIRVSGVAATPEPTSLAVFALGAVAAGYAGWRRRKATPAQNA